MSIQNLQKTWDTLGKEDAMWAVLTDPSKKGKKWDSAAFFATGESEVSEILQDVSSLGIKLQTKKALDFGCGVGRLTQALAGRFDEAVGVDIAPSMIEQAKQLSKKKKNTTFLVNSESNLQRFADNTFDFIYSNITLQHMKPTYQKAYLKEFLRILQPKGLLIFQIPSEPANTVKGIMIRVLPFAVLTKLRRNMEMHAMKQEEVVKLLQKNKGKIQVIKSDNNAGQGWISYTYFVSKNL
jgi:ubiquinone/menaquinone biosynthesis C-methylase UbiE